MKQFKAIIPRILKISKLHHTRGVAFYGPHIRKRKNKKTIIPKQHDIDIRQQDGDKQE